jgi:uncharacterized protein (TIGR02246 family)
MGEAMKRLLLAMLLVPASLALAAEGLAPEEKKAAPSDDPMAGWVPPKVTNETKDKQEILALMRSMEAAGKKGDLDAAAALVDFPVTMITDDSKGDATGEAWSREQWIEVMKPFYDKPMKDTKVTHKPTIFLLSDSLASVDDICTMTTGGKTLRTRNSTLLIRRDGKWLVKAMAEGGWGDMMAAQSQGTASGAQGPASEGTGSGTGTEGPASQGTGSGAEGPASQGTGSGAQSPAERTTK